MPRKNQPSPPPAAAPKKSASLRGRDRSPQPAWMAAAIARSGSLHKRAQSPPTSPPPAGLRRGGSLTLNGASEQRKVLSSSPADYNLKEEVGYGANAVVYRAIYSPENLLVAIKVLDLERENTNLDDVLRETHTLSLIDHPNVITAYTSFVVDHNLWVVTPFMSEGSCLHLMKYSFEDGFDEPVICSILKETLKALEYIHHQGQIHRDVKAGNILVDSPGVVKLGDFGVSASMYDQGDRRSRHTFVGTPCWMAPEVMQPGAGYDFKADIWSFGITALELAHGHAPFSKFPPMKVLLMTLQNAPPGLDYERDKRFSKSFREVVGMCLMKDPTKRPTAEKLLKHPFFKNAKPPESTLKSILNGLPPLWDRVKELQQKDADQLALKKMQSSDQEALSLSEYKRGVSAWHFDIDDLKVQAALSPDVYHPEVLEEAECRESEADKGGPSMQHHFEVNEVNKSDASDQHVIDTDKHEVQRSTNDLEPVSVNNVSSPALSSGGSTDSLGDFNQKKDSLGDKSRWNMVEKRGRFSVVSGDADPDKDNHVPTLIRKRSQLNFHQLTDLPSGPVSHVIVSLLQNLSQQTAFQQDIISKLLDSLHQNQGIDASLTGPQRVESFDKDLVLETSSLAREKQLLNQIAELQGRMSSLTNEFVAVKLKQLQLYAELKSLPNREVIDMDDAISEQTDNA